MPITTTKIQHASSNIQRAFSSAEVFSIIQAKQRPLCFFDIDDTLISTVGVPTDSGLRRGLGGDAWFSHFLTHSQAGHDRSGALARTVALYAVLQQRAVHQPVDKDTVNLFQQCRAQSDVVMLGLTARSESISGITQNTLERLGLSFTGNQGEPDLGSFRIDLSEPGVQSEQKKSCLFQHNILFCSGQDKGRALNAFCRHDAVKSIVSTRDALFFVDDNRKNCESVKRSAPDCVVTHFEQQSKEVTYGDAEFNRDQDVINDLEAGQLFGR